MVLKLEEETSIACAMVIILLIAENAKFLQVLAIKVKEHSKKMSLTLK